MNKRAERSAKFIGKIIGKTLANMVKVYLVLIIAFWLYHLGKLLFYTPIRAVIDYFTR